jgi:cellulose synthase/poly-beta-1,6-N-acetylglucosamine synthase-like glycosyltransferase
MVETIKKQKTIHLVFYVVFALIGFVIIMYYLSNTLIHFTTTRQFPINSFERFPMTFLIFPAEVFSFLFSLYFVYNLIHGNTRDDEPDPLPNRDGKENAVAILMPVYHEPKAIVERTLIACKQLRWRAGINLYLLDDSNNEADKKNMDALARKYDATVIRRKDREGYKAGNINNAVKHHITENYFVILDSDQAPEPDFLEHTMDHFSNPFVGFVQTPQHFINRETPLERAQQLGSDIFYQAQCISKAKDKALPFCGTNLVVRTKVFREVNGFAYYTATEDIELGLRMNEAGYHGAYVAKVLVKGYATEHYKAYSSQQYRWANGNLAILRKNWPKIFFGPFTLRQQIHTIFTLGWWMIGIVSFIYILVPMLSFVLGGTHHTWLPTILLGLLFLNVVMGISIIYVSLQNRLDSDRVTFKDAFLQYSLITNSMFIYATAAINAALGRYIGFVRTDKGKQQTGLAQIKWNLLLAVVCFAFSLYSLYMTVTASSIEQLRTYLPISAWMLFYSIILTSAILFVGKSAEEKSSKKVSA